MTAAHLKETGGFCFPTGKDFVHLVETRFAIVLTSEVVDPSVVLCENSSLEDSILAPVPFVLGDPAFPIFVTKLEGSFSRSENLSAFDGVETTDNYMVE